MTLIEVTDRGYLEANPEGLITEASPGLNFLGRDWKEVKQTLEYRGWKWQYIVPYTSEALHGKTKITLSQPSPGRTTR